MSNVAHRRTRVRDDLTGGMRYAEKLCRAVFCQTHTFKSNYLAYDTRLPLHWCSSVGAEWPITLHDCVVFKFSHDFTVLFEHHLADSTRLHLAWYPSGWRKDRLHDDSGSLPAALASWMSTTSQHSTNINFVRAVRLSGRFDKCRNKDWALAPLCSFHVVLVQ